MTVTALHHQSFQLMKITFGPLATKNVVWLNKDDFLKLYQKKSNNEPHYLSVANLIYQAEILKGLQVGKIGFNNAQYTDIRKSVSLSNEAEVVFVAALKDPMTTWAPINQVVFQVIRDHDQEAWQNFQPVNLPLKELRSSVLDSFNSQIIHRNQSFIFQHATGNYRLVAKEIHFDSKIPPPSQLVGRVAEETVIDFQVEKVSNIFIVDHIVDCEIESFHFNLKLLHFNPLDQTLPRPIKLDLHTLRKEIEDLSEKKEIVLGQKFLSKRHPKWQIEYELANVKLKQEEDDDDHYRLYKLAFDLKKESLIHFHFEQEDFRLTETDPLPLKEIEVKLLEHTTSYADKEKAHNRKSFVCLNEFQTALKKLNRTFAVGEHFYLSLSSGEYVAKVLRSVGKDGTRDDLEEKYKNLWCLDPDTEIQFKSSDQLKLKLIDEPKIYPLEKIKVQVKVKSNLFFGSDKITLLKFEELKKAFLHEAKKEVVVKDQWMTDVGDEKKVKLTITSMESKKSTPELKHGFLGQLNPETEILFEPEGKAKIITKESEVEISDPVQYIEDQGVGGLSDQMKDIVRNILIFRGPLRNLMKRRGIEPMRGLLFKGPPGTGKTLLARTLSKMLGALGENVQKINGPEIFNKFYGESEKNIRELFKPARESPENFFVIIIDEIDAILSKRQETVNKGDNKVVTQFLGEMDGLNTINNILVIGMTNRLEQIDEAALRPGRLENIIEIGLPNSSAREKIIQIHINKSEKKFISDNIDIDEFVRRTEGFSGAEIEGCFKRAHLFSGERLSKLKLAESELENHPDGVATWQDFLKAIGEIDKLHKKDDLHLTMFG